MDRGYFALRPENDLPASWDADAALTYTPGASVATASKLAATATAGRFRKTLLPGETRGHQRGQAVLTAQAFVRGTQYSASIGWPGVIGLGLDDGVRGLVVVIADSLTVAHPVTGSVLATVTAAGHRWDLRQHYRLEKRGQERWNLWVRERLVGSWPYALAPELAGATPTDLRARASFGLFDALGSATAEFDGVVVTANSSPAFPSEVQRFASELPAVVEWNARWDAIALACAGLISDVVTSMENLWGELAGGAAVILRAAQSPGAAPADGDTPWTVTGTVQVVRSGWRLTSPAGVEQSLVGIDAPSTSQRVLAASWVAEVGLSASIAGGVNDEVGPFMSLESAGRAVHARMFEDTSGAGTLHYWTLIDGAAATDSPLGSPYQISPRVRHRVEVVLVPDQGAILKIDGKVVSHAAWADLPLSASQRASIEADRSTWLVDDALVRVAAFDLSLRPEFRRALADRLIPTLGCERNDVLERWAVDRWAMHEHRGTTRGIAEEISRMLCGASSGGYTPSRHDGTWILDGTFPDHDAIVFDPGDEVFARGIVELPVVPGMSTEELSRIVASYILPLSAYEARFSVHRAEPMTGSSSTSGGKTVLPVADTTGFAVGDVVEVRAAADAVGEVTAVSAITAGVSIEVLQTQGSWVAADVVRLLLYRT